MAELAGQEGLEGRRLYLLIAVGVAVLFMLLFLFFRSCGGGGSGYTTIYSDLDLKDAAQIAKKLEEEKILYRSEAEGTSISVPKEETARARMLLATAGLPTGGVVGFEIFNETQMGASSFDRQIKLTRAVSGELSRAIASLTPVDRAKVQLVIPEKKLFSEKENPVTASVLLRLKPGQELSPDQVNGIVYLVSSSVEGLLPENVVVVDESSRILSGAFQSKGLTLESPPLAMKKIIEKELKVPVEKKLEEKSTPPESKEGVGERLEAQQQAKLALEKDLTEKGAAVLSHFFPSQMSAIRVNVELAPNKAGEPVLRRLTTLILVDHQISLTRVVKRDTFAAIASAIGYDRARHDRIELRHAALVSHPHEAVKSSTGTTEGVSKQGEPSKRSFGLQALFAKIKRVPHPSRRVIFYVIGGVGMLLIFRFMWLRWKRGREARQTLPTADILSPRPARREGIEAEATTRSDLKRLAETDPEKIANVLKHWLGEENG